MQIRRYRDRDAPAVRALFIRVNEELASPELRGAFDIYVARALRDEIDRIPDYYGSGAAQGFWVAEDERSGRLLGTFGLEPAADRAAELRRMYVAPEARRRGIGRALLAEAERLCAEAGVQRIVLSTSELQRGALALYRAAGYRLVREEIASGTTNKTVGAGLRRFHFDKDLRRAAAGWTRPRKDA